MTRDIAPTMHLREHNRKASEDQQMRKCRDGCYRMQLYVRDKSPMFAAGPMVYCQKNWGPVACCSGVMRVFEMPKIHLQKRVWICFSDRYVHGAVEATIRTQMTITGPDGQVWRFDRFYDRFRRLIEKYGRFIWFEYEARD